MMFAADRDAVVVLVDGKVFRGWSFGAPASVEGEVVFTTSMTGYQEVATDPSFRGQIVCMTYPIIGNYGVTQADNQSRRPWISGMIVREYCDQPNNWRSEQTFSQYLKAWGIPALYGVDTRALTRHIRNQGAMAGVLVTGDDIPEVSALADAAHSAWTPADANVVADVSVVTPREVSGGDATHVVLIDCGVKEHIIQSLTRRGVHVTVVPFDTSFADIVALQPDGVLTSPGPGDPVNVPRTVETINCLVEAQIPYFGVCLGHQLLALAVGASTSKLKFGHRGGNHPVQDLRSGRVYITSQNHGYQVDAGTVPEERGWHVSKININDGSVEGLRHDVLPVFSVQYHPEGSPGPQDSQYLFDEFLDMIATAKPSTNRLKVIS